MLFFVFRQGIEFDDAEARLQLATKIWENTADSTDLKCCTRKMVQRVEIQADNT